MDTLQTRCRAPGCCALLYDWSRRSIDRSPKRGRQALGAPRPRCPGRLATLIENQGPSIESLVSFDRIVTVVASGPHFLRGFCDRGLIARSRSRLTKETIVRQMIGSPIVELKRFRLAAMRRQQFSISHHSQASDFFTDS